MEAKKILTPLCFQLLPGEIINGKYCECSNMDCPRDRDTGLICGGEKGDIYMHLSFLASVKCSKNSLHNRRYWGAHWSFWHNARDTREERNRKFTPLIFFIPRSCVSRVAPKTPVSSPIRPVALIVQSTATAPPSAIAIGWGMQSGKL